MTRRHMNRPSRRGIPSDPGRRQVGAAWGQFRLRRRSAEDGAGARSRSRTTLLVHDHQVTALHSRYPAPPLGMGELPASGHRADPFPFEIGHILLLYTDGVIEARSPTGDFYPLAERVASFSATSPDALLRHIHDDLLDHVGEQPTDDAALLVIERTASHHLHRPHVE